MYAHTKTKILFFLYTFRYFLLLSTTLYPLILHSNSLLNKHLNYNLAFSQITLPSNANNFHGMGNAVVNPRTGNANFSFIIASFLYNHGINKRDLVLYYSGTSVPGKSNIFELGSQWHWNIGTEQTSVTEIAGHKTTDLITSDGHSFTMIHNRTTDGKATWKPLRHKLYDIKVKGHINDWTITFTNGRKEHIYNGYENWEETPSGQRIWFYYNIPLHNSMHTRHLIYICGHSLNQKQIHQKNNACLKDGIRLDYKGEKIYIHGFQNIVIHRISQNGNMRIQKISMPNLSTKNNLTYDKASAKLYFTYDDKTNRPWLLSNIIYPNGESTTFLYNNETSSKKYKTLGLATGIHKLYLPVVTEIIQHSSSFAIPDKHIHYRYGYANNNNNYTGYQHEYALIPGRDNLLDRHDTYIYGVTQDNGIIKTTIIYNKYHLPLQTIQTDSRWNHIISKHNFFYHPWKNTIFQNLTPNYALGLGGEDQRYTIAESSEQHIPFKIMQSWRYDNYGRRVWQRDSWGRETFIQYCPSSGNKHCPVNKNNLITRYPEKILTIPARNKKNLHNIQHLYYNTEADSAIEIIFNYIKIPDTESFWEIKKKQTFYIPLSQISYLNINKNIPLFANTFPVAQTEFEYDVSPNSITKGLLRFITVTDYSQLQLKTDRDHHLKNFTINDLKHINKPQQLKIKIDRKIKKQQNITIVSIDNKNNFNSSLEKKSLTQINSFNLGETVYSAVTGQLLSKEDTMHTMQIVYHYDKWNRLDKTTQIYLQNKKASKMVTTWKYFVGTKENSIIATDPLGNQIKTVWGGGKILSTWHRFNTKKNETNLNWIPDSSNKYTFTGNILQHTTWRAADKISGISGKALSLSTTYGYDCLNRQIWTKSPDGVYSFTIHDDASLREISYVVATEKNNTSQLHPMLSVTTANILGKPKSIYQFSFNSKAMKYGKPLYSLKLQQQLQKLILSIKPIIKLHTLNSEGLLPLGGSNGILRFIQLAINNKSWITHKTFSYDSAGHLQSKHEENGKVTRWIWKNGNLKFTILPDKREINDNLDIQGNLIRRCVKILASKNCHVLGERHYDTSGNLQWQSDQNGKKIFYSYDPNGRVTSIITPAPQKTALYHTFTYSYNNFGLTQVKLDGILQAWYKYDPKTWRLIDKEDAVSHKHYTYNKYTGQLITITQTSPITLFSSSHINYPNTTKTFSYDRYGRVIKWTDPLGNIYRIQHNNLDQEIALWVKLKLTTTEHLLFNIKYDNFNRPYTLINGIGILRSFKYDNSNGQIQEAQDKLGEKILQKEVYSWDPNTGYLLQRIRQKNKSQARWNYNYDIIGNMSSMTCKDSNNKHMLCPRDTDNTGNDKSNPLVIISQQYTFDNWNNISGVTEKLIDEINGKKLTKTITYLYKNQDSNLEKDTKYDPHQMLGFTVQWSNQTKSSLPYSLKYDELGRVIVDTKKNTLHYNARGLLDKFTRFDTGEFINYYYNSDNEQIAEQPFNKKGIPIQHPLYMFNENNKVIAQMQQDNNNNNHESAELGMIAHSEDGKITKWYLENQKGDVTSIFNEHGTQIQDMVNSPYGMTYNLINSNKEIFGIEKITNQTLWIHLKNPGFNHTMNDPATGYQFLGSRAYNPIYRRFMMRDSWSPFIVMDGFGFGSNNPIMYSDPSGHAPQWLGYAMAGAGILSSITLGSLAPIAIGISGMIGGIASAITGVISGSLQIASSVHPENQQLAQANKEFMLFNNLSLMFLDVQAIESSIMNMASWTGKIALTSSIGGALSSLAGAGASAMSLIKNSDLAPAETILNTAANWLSISFIGSSLAGIVSADKIGAHLKERGNCFSGDTKILLTPHKKNSIKVLHPGMQIMTSRTDSQKIKYKNNLLKNHKMVVKLNFIQTLIWNNLKQTLPTDCLRNKKNNKELFCKGSLEILTTKLQSSIWNKEQKQNGYIILFLKKMGLNHKHAHIVNIKEATFKKQQNKNQRIITAVIKRYAFIMKYKLKNIKTGKVAVIHVTPDHKFYVPKKHKYIAIGSIGKNKMVSYKGDALELLCSASKANNCGYQLSDKPQPVYNLEVDERHNYFAGSIPALVHNGCYNYFYKCETCNEAHGTRESFSIQPTHFHQIKTINQCAYCGYQFKSLFGKPSHMSIHTPRAENTNYTCVHCNATFAGPYTLKSHIEMHENQNFKIFCRECDNYIALAERHDDHYQKAHSASLQSIVIQMLTSHILNQTQETRQSLRRQQPFSKDIPHPLYDIQSFSREDLADTSDSAYIYDMDQ